MAVRKTKKKVTEADLVPTKDRQVFDETLRSFGKRSMKKYATETNEERALPDLFDGLKPVQRRILWTMSQHPRNEFVKAARTVGDALGKYHPHGDSSVYGAMITMNHMPTPLLFGRGNWGNMVDGAAAYRYTNARLSAFGYLFFDSDYANKEVTSFVPNYDDKDVEPVKLPAMLPYVLMTANEGVGVGITGKLPAFTAESLIAILKRMLDGEKLLPKDYASTLKYAHKWGGLPINSKENKEQWLRLFTGPEANVKFMSDATIDHDRKRIHISDWPQGTNLQKFMDKVRAMKETLRIESTKKSANLTIVCKPVYNMPQFEAYAQRVLKATHTSIAFKLNVTRRTASVVDGKTVYNNEVQALSVPEMLQAWLKERVQLELSSLAYRKRKQEAAIAYSELLIFACDKLDIIFKALRAKDADQFLIRALKITEEQARQILELRVRQLSKLDQDALKLKLKEQRQFLRQLEAWAKRPRAKIKADLDGVLEAINKDRNFKDKVDNQKLTLV